MLCVNYSAVEQCVNIWDLVCTSVKCHQAELCAELCVLSTCAKYFMNGWRMI